VKQRAAVALLLALAACHPAQPANQAAPADATANLADARRVPAPDTGVGSAALPAPELDGVATASGRWRFQVSADGEQAIFGLPGQPAAFSMRCEAEARHMLFSRDAAGESGATLQIIAADGAATFAAKPDGHGRILASDFVQDTFLTQVLAEAKGRIGVRIGSGATLAMPSDPVIGQTIKRCAAPGG
jgi:hypothetical protein